MKAFFHRLYWYYFHAVFSVPFLLFYPLIRSYLKKPKLYPKAHRLRKRWAKLLFSLCGIRYKIIQNEKVNLSGTYVIISNHTSTVDIPLSVLGIPLFFGFLAKKELSDIPLLNIFFKTIDLEVDRENSRKSAVAYKRAFAKLQSGQSLMIFAEGGILPDPTQLKPFKDGPFHLAIRAGVPILPVSMPDSWLALYDDEKRGKPAKIRLILHPPIETEGLTDSDTELLKKKVFEIIDKDIKATHAHRFTDR